VNVSVSQRKSGIKDKPRVLKTIADRLKDLGLLLCCPLYGGHGGNGSGQIEILEELGITERAWSTDYLFHGRREIGQTKFGTPVLIEKISPKPIRLLLSIESNLTQILRERSRVD
jgi:hypothetical protein